MWRWRSLSFLPWVRQIKRTSRWIMHGLWQHKLEFRMPNCWDGRMRYLQDLWFLCDIKGRGHQEGNYEQRTCYYCLLNLPWSPYIQIWCLSIHRRHQKIQRASTMENCWMGPRRRWEHLLASRKYLGRDLGRRWYDQD